MFKDAQSFLYLCTGGTFPPSRSYVYSQPNRFHSRVLRALHAKFRKSFQQISPIVFHSENAFLNRLNYRLYLHPANGEIAINRRGVYFVSSDKLPPVRWRNCTDQRNYRAFDLLWKGISRWNRLREAACLYWILRDKYQMSDSLSFEVKIKSWLIKEVFITQTLSIVGSEDALLKVHGKLFCLVISTLELTLKVNGTCSRIYLQSLWKHNVTTRSISGLKSRTFSYRARKQSTLFRGTDSIGWLMQNVCIWRQNLNTLINDSTLKNSLDILRSGLCSFSEWY